MIRPLTSIDNLQLPKAPKLFVLVELLLLVSIPVIGWVGSQALLDTRAGTIVEQVTPGDPGYVATVAASPVTALVEVLDGSVTGVAIVAQQSASEPGGALVLVAPSMLIDGTAVSTFSPSEVVPALETALRLDIPTVHILDESRWANVLGKHSLILDNPDPVVDDGGEPLLAVGEIAVGADLAAVFVGRPLPDGLTEPVIVRRLLWWNSILQDPPDSSDEVAALIRAIGNGVHIVDQLPREADTNLLDIEAAEAMVVEYVPYPKGENDGDRLKVRVLDRVGGLDVGLIARSLTREGFEITEIGNAEVFLDGPATVTVPAGVTDERIAKLAQLYGADTVQPLDLSEQVSEVTLTVGSSAAETS